MRLVHADHTHLPWRILEPTRSGRRERIIAAFLRESEARAYMAHVIA